jgi:hypothetical protein
LDDFAIERHTLVIEKITQVFHHSSTTSTQVPTARAHLSRVRAQLLRRFSGFDFPPFPPSSEEEEEAQREAERRAEREDEREVERMLGDKYERPEGSGKPPMDPEATFMHVLDNLVVNQ